MENEKMEIVDETSESLPDGNGKSGVENSSDLGLDSENDTSGIEVDFGGKKETFDIPRLQELIDAESRLAESTPQLEKSQRDYLSLQRLFDKQKNELGELRKIAGKKTAQAPEEEEIDFEDLEPEKVVKTMKAMQEKIDGMNTRIAELTDPAKMDERQEMAAFTSEIKSVIKENPFLKQFKFQTAQGLVDEAIEWAVEQNKKSGTEVFSSVRDAVDGFPKIKGLNATVKPPRQIQQIMSRNGQALTNVPSIQGGSSGSFIDRYLKSAPEERIKLEKGLTTAQSRELGFALERMDQGNTS